MKVNATLLSALLYSFMALFLGIIGLLFAFLGVSSLALGPISGKSPSAGAYLIAATIDLGLTYWCAVIARRGYRKMKQG